MAAFKPTRITKFEIKEDTSDWKEVWSQLQNQLTLFDEGSEPRKAFPKVPYKFYYTFEDEAGRSARLMIEDWEIGQLYWNCLKDNKGDASIAVEKVREDVYKRQILRNAKEQAEFSRIHLAVS